MPSETTIKWIKRQLRNPRLNSDLRSIFMDNVNEEENMRKIMYKHEWNGETLESSTRGKILVNSYIKAKYKQIS